MKFVLLLEQGGGGCDYTIACGKDFLTFDAQNWAEAVVVARKIVAGELNEGGGDAWIEGGLWGDNRLEFVQLYEVDAGGNCPFNHWYDSMISQRNARARALSDKESYDQYLKLKARFEVTNE